MTDCNICVHKAVCDLWCEQESQTAECYSTDGNKCSYFHQDNKWIPVSERLPDTFGEYLVAVKDVSGQVYSDYADYDPFRQKWTTGLFLGVKDKITHWIPLPNPPKEVDK